METDEERKARLEKMVSTERLRLAMKKLVVSERLRLAMEMDEERKARLEKMVATTQLRLALETEQLDWNICQTTQYIYIYIPNILYLISRVYNEETA